MTSPRILGALGGPRLYAAGCGRRAILHRSGNRSVAACRRGVRAWRGPELVRMRGVALRRQRQPLCAVTNGSVGPADGLCRWSPSCRSIRSTPNRIPRIAQERQAAMATQALVGPVRARPRHDTAALGDLRVPGVLLFVVGVAFITVTMLLASIVPAYDYRGAAVSDLGVIAESALWFNILLVTMGVLNITGGYLCYRSPALVAAGAVPRRRDRHVGCRVCSRSTPADRTRSSR